MPRNYQPVRREAALISALGEATQLNGLAVALTALNQRRRVPDTRYGSPTFFSDAQDTARYFIRRSHSATSFL